LLGVAGLWIERARGTKVRAAIVLGFFVRAESLGSLFDVTWFSDGLADIQRSIQLQPQLGFPWSVNVGVTVRPDFFHCMRQNNGIGYIIRNTITHAEQNSTITVGKNKEKTI
jgi:hypothetical protein